MFVKQLYKKENLVYNNKGNTAQRAAGAFAAHLLAYFPSYCTKIF